MFLMGVLGAALGAAAFFLRSQYERKHFVTESFEIETDKIEKDWTFAFLSDLHNQEFGKDNEQLLNTIDSQKPDAVLIGGDTMVCKGKPSLMKALYLVRALVAKYPVYYGNGNHEARMKRQKQVYGTQYDRWKQALMEAGVFYLEDETKVLNPDIAVSGLEIEEKYYKKFRVPEMGPDYVRKHLGKAHETHFQILMAHSPLYFDAYGKWGADLTLCGHFHGGTVRLPFLGGVMTPQFQFFLPCCGGAFEKNGRHMIVSRGLGTHSINVRFNNKPQLVIVKLTKKKADEEKS